MQNETTNIANLIVKMVNHIKMKPLILPLMAQNYPLQLEYLDVRQSHTIILHNK